MALSLHTNVASLQAQRNILKTQGRVSKSMEKLSSGMRINRASDDAAGLAISEKLKAQIRSLSQAGRNGNDGISLLQTAEGALNETNSMLVRMRELSMQAANGTLGDAERLSLDKEFSALRSEIDRIANSTEFNGRKLLDGTATTTTFQIGIQNVAANDRITVTIGSAKATTLGVSSTMTISTAGNAQSALATIDTAISRVTTRRGEIGAAQNRLEVTVNNLSAMHENLSAANSRIRDADIANETAQFAQGQILMQAGMSVLAQANQLPSMALSLLG